MFQQVQCKKAVARHAPANRSSGGTLGGDGGEERETSSGGQTVRAPAEKLPSALRWDTLKNNKSKHAYLALSEKQKLLLCGMVLSFHINIQSL